MKRVAYIILWTVGAVILAYTWNDLTRGWYMAVAETIAALLGGGDVALAFSYLPFAAVSPAFCVATLIAGSVGLLPGTGRHRK